MASVAQTAVASSTTDTATPTYTAQAIGANGGSDILYVIGGARSVANASTMACTIDGITAPQIAFFSQNDGGGIRSNLGLFALARNSLPDPNQTDVDIVLTLDQTNVRHSCAVAVSSDAGSSAFATATAGAGSSGVNVNTPALGIVIGAAYNGDATAFTFTGLTEVSDLDVAGEGSNRFGTAYASNVSSETPRTISITTITDSAAKLAASFSSAESIPVTAADATFAGQTIDVVEDPIGVTAAQAAFAGQEVDIVNPTISVDAASVAVDGQTISVLGEGSYLDLSASLYTALADDSYITTRLGSFMSPSIHTRRPVPEGAEYPMIVVNPDSGLTNEDGLRSRRPVIVRDVITYGEQDDQYRVVEEIAYYIRDKFHRRKDSITVPGFSVIDIVTSGPVPAPTDDFQHVARVVTLTIRLLQEA